MPTIAVVPHNSQWKAEFGRIREELNRGFQGLSLAIEHVGSTSVEGLPAKPIIDIDVVISDMLVFDSAAVQLQRGLCPKYLSDMRLAQ